MPTSMERRPPVVLSNRETTRSADARAVAGDVLGQRWGKMQGWQVLSGPSGGGGITGGVGLTLSGNIMDLDPATGTTIGGMTEPPPTGRGFMRRNAAGIASWVDVDVDGGRF